MILENGVAIVRMTRETLDLTPHVAMFMLRHGKGTPLDISAQFDVTSDEATALILLAGGLLQECGIAGTRIRAELTVTED